MSHVVPPHCPAPGAPSQSVQFSRSVVSDSLWPHESQHARPPCPSPTRRVYSNPYPSSRWCHPAVSSSAIPFSSCPQSLLASGSFPKSQLFAWGDQSIWVSASASVLPMNTQDWSPLGWAGWISLGRHLQGIYSTWGAPPRVVRCGSSTFRVRNRSDWLEYHCLPKFVSFSSPPKGSGTWLWQSWLQLEKQC